MHGGSGLSDYDFKKVIAHGINKINIFSEISLSSSRLLYKSLKKVDGNIHIQEALSETSDDIVLIIKKYIDLFHNL
jgi:fructose-bisphosphate aldolase class II